MNMKGELHLLIIWEKARYLQENILNDIKQNLKILECFEIEWSRDYVAKNFTRFYGVKLPNRSFKEKECGCGKFLLVIVWDDTPHYEKRKTSHGEETVNIRMFDLKTKYRKWTGGGHKIHATNNPQETNHDITLLLGINYNDYLSVAIRSWDNEIKQVKRDLSGTETWKNLEELFYVLNNTVDYVILRGFENLFTDNILEKHLDIDLLIEDYKNVVYLLNGSQICFFPIRPKVKVMINGKVYIFDLWETKLPYHTYLWHKRMLQYRIMKRGVYCLDIENDFYALIYHCLIHKSHISSDYLPYLEKEFYQLKLDNIYNIDNYTYPMDLYYDLLIKFMSKNKYEFSRVEEDWHCFYSKKVVGLECACDYLKNNTPIQEIQPCLIGNYTDSGYVYFKGYLDGLKVFIKYGGVKGSCENEYFYSKKISTYNSKYFLSPLFYLNDGEHSLVVFEYLDGIKLSDYLKYASIREKLEIQKQMGEIYQSLYESHIVHRDIRPDNFLVVDGVLKLLDFQFSVDALNYKEVQSLIDNSEMAVALGTKEFKYKKYGWNDSYSLKKTCLSIGLNIDARIDKSNVKINMPITLVIKYFICKMESFIMRRLYYFFVRVFVFFDIWGDIPKIQKYLYNKLCKM